MKWNASIDILKTLCIVFILITHSDWNWNERCNLLFPYWIDMAVPIFMYISGYVYSQSYIKNGINNLSQMYKIKNLYNRAIRFVVPFSIMYVIQVLTKIILLHQDLSLFSLVKMYLYGAEGAGSYYFPCMIQFIFMFPIIFKLINKYKEKSLMVCFIANITYEVLQRAYDMNEACYRLLVFRYIFVIACGCYFRLYGIKIRTMYYVLSLLIGVGYIYLVVYTKYTPKVIIYWTRTSLFTTFYIVPIVNLFISLGIKKSPRIITLISNSTFNIFLTQATMYSYLAGTIYRLNILRWYKLILFIIIGLSVGVVFYLIEQQITKKLKMC